MRAVEGQLFHLVEVTGECSVVLGSFLSQYLSQSWGKNIVKKKQTTCHNNKNMIYRENIKSTTWTYISKPLKKHKKANTYKTKIMPVTYITLFSDVAVFWF